LTTAQLMTMTQICKCCIVSLCYTWCLFLKCNVSFFLLLLRYSGIVGRYGTFHSHEYYYQQYLLSRHGDNDKCRYSLQYTTLVD
jgi:hypothetical protein